MQLPDFLKLRKIFLGIGLGVTCVLPAAAEKTVVIFFIDGLMPQSAKTAADNGAINLKFMMDSGVVVEKPYTPYPKDGLKLEDGTVPWGNVSGGNLGVHTGCHIFESKQMDDIFLAAREKGIKSVYAGGSQNYTQITTPDFELAGELTDKVVVDFGIEHFQKDKTRLIRLHPQRIRDAWSGPAGLTNPTGAYIKAIAAADAQLGRLFAALKAGGVWDSTYVIVAADHGMGTSSSSLHDADQLPSWIPFISFRGPGLKKGATIPYAELPDLAIMAGYFLGLRPLKGDLDPSVTLLPKGPTGSFLPNLFLGAPKELAHPMYVAKFLEAVSDKPKADYVSYRNTIMPILKAANPVTVSMQARRRMEMTRHPERFAITATADGLRIEAPWEFDRIDLIGADGRARLVATSPSAREHTFLSLRLPAGTAAVRVGKAGSMTTHLIAARP